jgi:hypothetical protein
MAGKGRGPVGSAYVYAEIRRPLPAAILLLAAPHPADAHYEAKTLKARLQNMIVGV